MRNIFNITEKPKDPSGFNMIRIGLASPERIREWSFGEVKKPETINYRTFKPERDGLFCAKIFGPVKDYECLCGKYKRMKHRGVVCEKCGVEVIQSKVRRERLGHIQLATPVVHIWFFKSLPSHISLLLDINTKNLEQIIYCDLHIVLDKGKTDLKDKQLLTDDELRTARDKWGADAFRVGIGAEAVKELLSRIDVEEEAGRLRKEMVGAKNDTTRKKIAKRLQTFDAFRRSGNRPEWMVLDILPVIPPDLRPLVPLDGGRFATSDLNDLYRRVINRNNRLKRLISLNAPEIIIRNEKRMLQEAVDALFDNGRRGKAITGTNKRPLKSLSDMLKGKQGRFRQNLLGKRVDYSGRTVIVIGPELKLHQCGLPKKMALELFKPFIYNKLEEKGFANNIKVARRQVEQEESHVWDILEDVIREHPVMLNRAPTLHRLGIQAFEPVLIEGKAIQLHPLVCTAFNADFDGDQMAVHVPLSIEAQLEARVLMMSTNNILSPANGKPIINPTQDIVLGIYWLTRKRPFAKGHGRPFGSTEEVELALLTDELDLHAEIIFRKDGKRYNTTAGRVILSTILPEPVPFEAVNKVMNKKALQELIDIVYRLSGEKDTVLLADRLRTLGYFFATRAGVSISIRDMHIPSNKPTIIEDAKRRVAETIDLHQKGELTSGERYNAVVDIWASATDAIAKQMMREIENEELVSPKGEKIRVTSFNPIYMMADSGARGSAEQMRQLAGMRGLMAKPSGEIIETPITSNFREGLSVLEYFISTHGARKGLADTALKTANSGYLTRRLVDIAHSMIVSEYDCGTLDGVWITPLVESGVIIEPLGDRILGRVALNDIKDPITGETIVFANEEIDEDKVKRIENSGIDKVLIRSVLTCKSKHGVCVECYGRDLARGRKVNLGEAVGIIAAQSIGEPGTQLTMRTFHIGGAASRSVEQSSLEARGEGIIQLRNVRLEEEKQGKIVIDDEGNKVRQYTKTGYATVMNRNGELVIIDEIGRERERYQLVYGAAMKVQDGDKVKAGQVLAEWDPHSTPILTEVEGIVKYGDITENITMIEKVDEDTKLAHKVIVESKDPDMRPRISIKDTEGRTLKLPGSNAMARYLLPIGATIVVGEGEFVPAGAVLAKIPRETTKTKDITVGLPRVVELFEARKPKKAAIVSEIDGIVTFDQEITKKGKRRVVITPDIGKPREYEIPKGKHTTVRDGDRVKAGEPLIDGSVQAHDILRILGEKELAKFLVNEIQEVYRRQGVRINDKHIEIIVRQMLRRVRVIDVGDTSFVYDQHVEKHIFEEENERAISQGKKPATGEPLLLGITKAALETESFLSASSFQETTRVLTSAAIAGKIDYLRSLKENVIIGRLIPAGTGLSNYSYLKMEIVEKPVLEIATEESVATTTSPSEVA